MLLQTFHQFSQHAMSPTAAIALHVAIGAFIIAAVTALAALLQPTRVHMRWADWAGALGTGSLLAYFVARFISAGTEPLQNMFDVVTLSALFLALIYFVATRVRKLPSIGAFAYPAIAIIFLVNLMLAGTATQGADAPLDSPLLVVHIVLTILAYGVFFLATVAAVMFLLQERMLKKHKDPAFMRSFPPLESLRRLVNSCILVGLPMLTLGFALGFAAFDAAAWSNILHNPKVITSLVLWLVLLAAFVGRRVGLLHGRRHYYMVLVGFALVLTTYIGLGVVEARNRQQTADSSQLERDGDPCSGL
ncbi:MAG: cytochrome c biogenesis protein CcsA [Planctomycetes bacterium]|nr:cytochrome c biogenesis protein CcsA [Planctomycetota bacterium]MCB9936584.1 cytochrome c biogenesis protein CcsA [Planctomycetota bacterium]